MSASKDSVRQILSQYERFGWKLHHALISPRLEQSLGLDINKLFIDCEIKQSDLAAAWFSRPNEHGQTAWELRALDDNPFALIEVVDAGILDSELDSVFEETENRLRERLNQRVKAH